jgi:hypothetical protein
MRLLLTMLATAVLSMAPPVQAANAVIEQVRSHHQGIAVWWVGNAGWLINFRSATTS